MKMKIFQLHTIRAQVAKNNKLFSICLLNSRFFFSEHNAVYPKWTAAEVMKNNNVQ